MEIEKEALLTTLGEMKAKGYDTLKAIFATDANGYIALEYLLYSTSSNASENIAVKLDSEKPEIEGATNIYRSADWYEREISEMLGIKILNRETRRLLLEEWNGIGFPLRKSFAWGSEYEKR